MILAAAALALSQASPFTFEVASGKGLTVTMSGVEVVRGSWFQYYAPDWSAGYYASASQKQQVVRRDQNSIEMRFQDSAGLLDGTQTYSRQGSKLKISYLYNWHGEKPVKVEMAAAMLWAPAFASGSLGVAPDSLGSVINRSFSADTPSLQRKLLQDSSTISLRAPIGALDVASSAPITLFDARGYGQPWASDRQLWWLGHLALDVSKDVPARLEVVLELSPTVIPSSPSLSITPVIEEDKVVKTLNGALPHLIPQPKTNRLDFTKPLHLSRRYTFPAGIVGMWPEFETALKQRFQVPAGSGAAIAVDGGESRMGLGAGGYKITTTEKSISVLGQDEEGVRNGMRRLASLVFVQDGKLMLPTGGLIDDPQTRWRGVHLFVGPKALEFHKKLWRRVLLPMGFNKVVLQCEQTAWANTKGTESPITMSKKDLKALFDWYRSVGVEPIPLIQSFGHMEWFLRNGKNLELAYNRDVPYTLDVRKPEARAKIAALWTEACELLKPKTIHFGCDEVDMRGFAPGSQELVTTMWEQYLPYLGELAKELGVRPMIWGDNALAPGEGPDATHGYSADHARRRRAAIPKGTLIADWHYRADPRPQTFYPVLQFWKREGFTPIASSWSNPDNVRGFHLAAVLERTGTLQTTWAGYESSEEAMLKELPQFSAMILAADYSWSGRQESVGALGYDADEVFRQMYFGEPESLTPAKGARLALSEPAKELAVGRWRFNAGPPTVFASPVTATKGPTALDIPMGRNASSMVLAVSTEVQPDKGDLVAKISIGSRTYPFVAGENVERVGKDVVFTAVVELPSPAMVDKIGIVASPALGVRLHGLVIR